MVLSGRMLRFTPPTMAAVDSPLRRLSHARCTATRDDDCPVSTVRLGPCSPRVYETRLAMMLRCDPVTV